ncbi:hypothetical protein Tsp_09992 [Trichinella spiralis]|uniref:hypothetical protein n=1 Tax=Trichinella spiralis TaxID=6334 RepID=UPI0001EFE3B5|nr:hypothetical protein Tsp_09992 [Trichinella spiralis]
MSTIYYVCVNLSDAYKQIHFSCKHSVITIIREHTCIRQPRVIIVCDIGYIWESVKSVIPIPSELNFEEYATIDDQLQVTLLLRLMTMPTTAVKITLMAKNSRQKQNWSNNSFFALHGASYLCVELWRCAKSVGQNHQTDNHSPNVRSHRHEIVVSHEYFGLDVLALDDSVAVKRNI